MLPPRLSIVCFATLWFATASAAALEPEGGPLLLRWKWAANQEWVAEFAQTVTTDSAFGAKNLRLAIASKMTQNWLVESVDAQGVGTIKQSYMRIGVDVDMGMGNTIAFDSERSDAPSGETKKLSDALRPLIGPTWKVLVSPRGELLRWEPSPELTAATEQVAKNSVLQPLFAGAGAVGPTRQVFLAFPEEPIQAGHAWRTTTPLQTSFGVGDIATDYKFEGVQTRGESSVATISGESQVNAKPASGKVAKSRQLKEQKTTSHWLFDSKNGMMSESRQGQSLRTESRVRDVPLEVKLVSEWSFTLRKKTNPPAASP
jgi:hypothetical protein